MSHANEAAGSSKQQVLQHESFDFRFWWKSLAHRCRRVPLNEACTPQLSREVSSIRNLTFFVRIGKRGPSVDRTDLAGRFCGTLIEDMCWKLHSSLSNNHTNLFTFFFIICLIKTIFSSLLRFVCACLLRVSFCSFMLFHNCFFVVLWDG